MTSTLLLKNVLYVHQFHFNLISVHQLCKHDATSVIVSKSSCFIQDHLTRHSLPLGKLQHGLYYVLDNNQPPMDSTTCSSLPLAGAVTSKSSIILAETWHLRFGHAPLSKIGLLYPQINPNVFKQQFFGTICSTAKQHRHAFPVSTRTTSCPFDLIHIDTWGPYSHKTHSGCSYFLTIGGDYTKLTWVYLIKNKNQCVSLLENFFHYVTTQYHSNVKVVRTDNAKELCAGAMLNIYNAKGIIHQRSCS